MRPISRLALTRSCIALLLLPTLNAASLWSLDGGPSRSKLVQAAPEQPFLNRIRDRIGQTIWPGYAEEGGTRGINRLGATGSLPENMLKKYGDDQVLRFEIENVKQRQAITEIADTLFLDIWGFSKAWVDIRLSKESMKILLGLLPDGIKWRPVIHHLALAVFQSQNEEEGELGLVHPPGEPPLLETATNSRPAARGSNIFFQKYQPLSVILPWMRLLRSLFPTHVRLVDIGTSWEGRPISAIRVGNHPHGAKMEGRRKVIIVAGGLHSREWISTSTVNYAAYELIVGYGKSRPITRLVEEFDFVFIPTLNPDGYVYTWEEDRLWRKSRQSTKFSFCPGVDLDRSFGFQWDGENTQGNPCSETYAGEAPFDAHEATEFAKWFKNRTEFGNDRIVGFFDLHSYSQQILYPYAYTCDSAPGSWEDLQEVGLGLEKAIYTTTAKKYTATSACEGGSTLTTRDMNGGGSLLDWAMSQGVTYSYQIKLRDTGSYGFLLPAKEIVPTGKEIYAAIQYFAQHLLDSSSVDGHHESPSTQQSALSDASREVLDAEIQASSEPESSRDFELRR